MSKNKEKDKEKVKPVVQQPVKLNWSPVEASWIVSIALVILAVLPHQIPDTLTHPLSVVVIAVSGLFVCWLKPVVGVAMLMMCVGIVVLRISQHKTIKIEPFVSQNLNIEPVVKHKRHLWLEDEMLFETPEAIQTLTEEPNLLVDSVTPHESQTPWGGEHQMGETVSGIQTKGVGYVE
jgi:hypothetical protein